jgi:hypothetical protein
VGKAAKQRAHAVIPCPIRVGTAFGLCPPYSRYAFIAVSWNSFAFSAAE